MITLIYGGSGSGKSAFAEDIVTASKCKNKYYLATMKSRDSESKSRIKRHKQLREGKNFVTVEQPVDIANAVTDAKGIVLLECMSNLVANEMFRKKWPLSSKECIHKVLMDTIKLSDKVDHLVIVTNNVFEDGLGYDETTKEYLRALGIINERLAEISDEVYEVVVGIGVKI